MNIVHLHSSKSDRPLELDSLFNRMEASLRSADVDFEKSVRMAKTLAPILNDQSSNERHLQTISSSAHVKEKVIAILMLGFPKNRHVLPILQDVLHSGTKAMRMAAALSIVQMRDGENNGILSEVLLNAYAQEKTNEIKNSIRHSLRTLASRRVGSEDRFPLEDFEGVSK